MFNINFARFAKNLIPWFMRTPKMKQWIGVLTWGASKALDDLKSFRTLKDYQLNFTGQRLYLERWLNDKFDPVNQAIEVNNIELAQNPFMFNKIEGRDNYVANKWDLSTSYVVGDRVNFAGKRWRCVLASTNNPPNISPAYWTEVSDVLFLYNKTEIGGAIVFEIVVPLTITLTDQKKKEIATEIDKFVVAGKQYQIISA